MCRRSGTFRAERPITRGGVQVGRWEKTYPTNPLKLYTKSGEEMTLNRGKTYFALVDEDERSNFSYQ